MKKKKSGFFVKIIATLLVIVAIFTGGYFFLDKKVVPKYFGQYGIEGVPDLVGLVTSLYNSPKESKLVSNGFNQTDFSNAVTKLKKAGYKINDDGTMQEPVFEIFKGDGKCQLTDRELASICNKFLEDGVLVDALPELNYLNVINISILEATITPDKDSVLEDVETSDGESFEGELYSKANLSLILKVDTTDICEQIATQMETPLFLLNMIIPDVIYFSVSYDIDLDKEGQTDANGSIAINGRTEKQSKILIDLLIDFIFPEEDEMNIDKFTEELGKVIVSGVDVLGEFKFAGGFGAGNKQNGVVVDPLAKVVTEE